MACALGWIGGGDFSWQSLSDSIAFIADLDGDDDLSADEEAYFNEVLAEVGFALTALGADAGNVQAFIDEEDDDAGMKLGEFLSEKLNDVEDDDESIISNYAVSNDPVMESTVKVVRDGKVTFKKKRIGRPHKLSAAQKAALKVARRKEFTGAAKQARKKSLKIRKQRGL
jgi:hypothetical protein